jgi:hypothetical protein
MVEDEMETKWRRAADERSMARRGPAGPTRDKLFHRANQIENSAMFRRNLISDPRFSMTKTHH